MELDEILKLLAANREVLQGFGVQSLSIFGSVVRGEAGPESDVDILVEFSRPVSLFGFVRLQQYLERLLNRTVDLVTTDALKHRLRDRIIREAVRAA